jgi:hypothetical protein
MMRIVRRGIRSPAVVRPAMQHVSTMLVRAQLLQALRAKGLDCERNGQCHSDNRPIRRSLSL